jgi:hypothetical protein
MITTTLKLYLGYALAVILDFYKNDIQGNNTAIANDRENWLGKNPHPATDEEHTVEAVIFDRHEHYWKNKPTNNSALDDLDRYYRLSHFTDDEAMTTIEQNGCLPATYWPLLCFGYQHRDYFKQVKHNGKWLIAPGQLIPFEQMVTELFPRNEHFTLDSREHLESAVRTYGARKILRVDGHKFQMPIENFLQKLPIDMILTVKLGLPAAVDTEFRSAIIWHYGESRYPRVLGIRP